MSEEEEYERMRTEDLEIIMEIVNGIPKVPRKTEDLEPYRALYKIHRDWRVRSIHLQLIDAMRSTHTYFRKAYHPKTLNYPWTSSFPI